MIGYLLRRLGQLGWGPWKAIVFSAVLRGSYHLYQGFRRVPRQRGDGPDLRYLYRRWGRVTPMIIAHTLIDAVTFVGYAALHGHGVLAAIVGESRVSRDGRLAGHGGGQ